MISKSEPLHSHVGGDRVKGRGNLGPGKRMARHADTSWGVRETKYTISNLFMFGL